MDKISVAESTVADAPVRLNISPNDDAREIVITVNSKSSYAASLVVDGTSVADFDIKADEDCRVNLPFDKIRSLNWQKPIIKEQKTGRELETKLEGSVVAASAAATPEKFFENLQLNHIRVKSPLALELGARVAFDRFTESFEVRAAALTIMAHRVLDRPIESLTEADFNTIAWIVDNAEMITAQGEKIINEFSEKPRWDYVRWTISLATVAGYLSLIENRIGRALAFFSLCPRYINLVKLSKVSALNLVNGCFVHGLLSDVVGRPDDARSSLTLGLQSIPEVVAVQDLLANVWVVGDLLNVLRTARQCFIALVRFDLHEPREDRGVPIIDEGSTISLGEIKGPLAKIVASGRPRMLSRHCVSRGIRS